MTDTPTPAEPQPPTVAELVAARRAERAGRYDPEAVDDQGLPTVGALIARATQNRNNR